MDGNEYKFESSTFSTLNLDRPPESKPMMKMSLIFKAKRED